MKRILVLGVLFLESVFHEVGFVVAMVLILVSDLLLSMIQRIVELGEIM
jgi:hypothetical protein